jgi:hypothetical protein
LHLANHMGTGNGPGGREHQGKTYTRISGCPDSWSGGWCIARGDPDAIPGRQSARVPRHGDPDVVAGLDVGGLRRDGHSERHERRKEKRKRSESRSHCDDGCFHGASPLGGFYQVVVLWQITRNSWSRIKQQANIESKVRRVLNTARSEALFACQRLAIGHVSERTLASSCPNATRKRQHSRHSWILCTINGLLSEIRAYCLHG